MLKSNLLATKLHRPALPARWVQRPHLSQRLDEGLELGRQITLVSAPAGFGKTTCVSEWLKALEGRCRVTWLSLDPADDDPVRFFACFVAALQEVDATLGRELEGVLRSAQLPPGEIIGATLIDDILALEDRFLLVLDDFHVIQDRFILQVLEMLVANLPQPLHLVLITREDPPLPLARLRANNLLTEIRARDLRFSTRDIDRFLNEAMGLSLSQADIAVLEEKTEGWIVGLQLVGLSARDRPNPSQFIAGLSGSHRYILSYLTEQVLRRQPEEIHHFLLRTSILDRLNGDLCDAVTGRSHSRALLERLFNANLFLIPLDDEGHWYRYHHLFADLLRDLQNVLQKDETAELHRRAGHWYAAAGEAFVSEAIRHALAAEDYALVVDLLEEHAMGMIMQGYAKTVNGWVQAIPWAWRSQSPRTDLALAWMHLLQGAYAQASPYLERSRDLFAGAQTGSQLGEEGRSLKAEWLVMQSLILNMQGKAAQGADLANEALAIAPQADSRVRSLAYWGLASACRDMEAYERAADAYQMAIQHGRATEHSIAEMMSIAGLSQMVLDRGQLHLSFEIASQAVDRIERSDVLPPISAVAYGVLAQIHYQWVELEAARRHIRRALELSTLGGYNSGKSFCRVFLSRLFQLEGDVAAAAREIGKAVGLVQGQVPDEVRREVVTQQVRVYLARNRPAAAQMALQGEGFVFGEQFSFPDLPSGRSIPSSLGLLYNSTLHLLLYQARARRELAGLKAAIELADRLIAGMLQGQYLLAALEALLLRAQIHAVLGDQPSSQADYARALELAEPEGFIGVFLEQGPPVAQALADLHQQKRLGHVSADYVRRILDAFSEAQTRAPGTTDGGPPSLVEPLTERELEVLGLMAQGLKYKEIASSLFISLNTVRFHVKAIYGKLNVNKRTQALEKARRLRLL